MKYGEVIQFEPIESVIQLRDADREDKARDLVRTYVISDRMAEVLSTLVFPQLQFDSPQDNKGLLVVGNYGTGKSHLLSVLSTIAERADLADEIRHPGVASAASAIAGRFQVVRLEIGSVKMDLRDILCGALEDWLDDRGIDFRFKPLDQVKENKTEIGRMMAAFHAKFPEHGLLLVVDELLDYLRTRNQQQLMLDLGFLREVGEVCKDLRFRFIGGVQESLFEHPRFQFAADSLNRVKDRFEQFRIARSDLEFVVANRLLRKSDEQRARIRAHLARFTSLYGAMQEKLGTYVELFPVHPQYLQVFERVRIGEKRQALKSLSRVMSALLDQDVPEAEPGLVAYDHYWGEIEENAGFRADPDVGKVIRCTETLKARVETGFRSQATQRLKGTAVRVIHGLGVQRLVDGDIRTPVGVTAEDLRDDLALTVPGVSNADFLKTSVETVLREIVRTVAGQFISFNSENGQYFLDIDKDVDFDAKIADKAETLSPSDLDHYYYQALLSVLECTDSPFKPGVQIWQRSVVWTERNADRPGYLFFGAPNERNTAWPPRDFYLYFVQPHEPPPFDDDQRADEVFFRLVRRDEAFDSALRAYAAAGELAQGAGGHRGRYEDKAREHLRLLNGWLREHLPTACEVTYQGVKKKLTEWARPSGQPTSRDLVFAAASAALAPCFRDKYADYPKFAQLITGDRRPQAAQDALAHIAGLRQTKETRAVLDALELLDGADLRVVDRQEASRGSRYATWFLDQLNAKPQGQALNRAEVIDRPYEGVEFDKRFKLDVEWVVVVLAALVAAENVTFAIAGRKFDATSIEDLARTSMSELAAFRHMERPRDYDLGALRELFKLLGLTEGLAQAAAQGQSAAVQQLQDRVLERIPQVVIAREQVEGGFVFWGEPLWSADEQAQALASLDAFKTFLEGLQPYNSPARLKTFRHTAAEVAGHGPVADLVKQVEALSQLLARLTPLANYLDAASAAIDPKHAWQTSVESVKAFVVAGLKDPAQRVAPGFKRAADTKFDEVRSSWQAAYQALHDRHRLGPQHDRRKSKLLADPRLRQLRALASIPHLPATQLREMEEGLAGIRACSGLVAADLVTAPLCPRCRFRPVDEAGASPASDRLDDADTRLTALVKGWTTKLLAELADPVVRDRLPILQPDHKTRVEAFLAEKALPDPVDPPFVEALSEALADLQQVRVDIQAFHDALVAGGGICTVDDLRERIDAWLDALTRGKELAKVRIVME